MRNIFEDEIKEMRTNNINDVVRNPKKYQDKLKKYAERYDFDLNYLQQEILENVHLINHIAKDPQKQNFHEKLVEKYINSNFEEFQEFEILPKNSEKSIYLSNGLVVSRNNLTTKNHTKSIDFKWKYKNYIVYASHKYTKDRGGAQDNQYDDVKSFLKHARENINKENLFIAICDGDYYREKKFQELRNLVIGSRKCIISSVDSLKKEIDKCIEDQDEEDNK